MKSQNTQTEPKMLLHACCGPCSMEPVRILHESDVHPVVFYANSNIAPASEYEKRLNTLKEWAASAGVDVIEDVYDNESWQQTAGKVGAAEGERREARCRACYRQRFERAAKYAAENGYEFLGTTLSVSPYQYTKIIEEELRRACEMYGIQCAFEDYSPNYSEATRRSREVGMYRQNYCGCVFSDEEAKAERKARKEERARQRAMREAEHAAEKAEKEAALNVRRKERAEYDAKQRRKREVLKAMRGKDKPKMADVKEVKQP